MLTEDEGPSFRPVASIQDLFPYFELGYTREQIIREAMPSLSVAEIDAARRYVAEHHKEVAEEDRRIRERNANRKNSPEIEAILCRNRAKLAERLEYYRTHGRSSSTTRFAS